MTEVNDIAVQFEKLDIQTHDPKWSSWVLERLFETVLAQPQATLTDLFRGFDLALKRNTVHLTETVANLVKDVIVTGFTKYRVAYDRVEWDWANDELARGASPARCYFFLHVLPPDKATPTALMSILRGLEGTPRFEEAVATLSDDFDRPEVKQELKRWQANGMAPQTADKIRPFV